MTKTKHGYRVSQIVDSDGQGWIALIKDANIVSRFTNWTDAKAAHRNAATGR